MKAIRCDICGDEIPVKDLFISNGKPLRFCKKCKKGFSDGLLPVSANRRSEGLSLKPDERSEDGLYQPPEDESEGLYQPPEDDSGGLYEPEE